MRIAKHRLLLFTLVVATSGAGQTTVTNEVPIATMGLVPPKSRHGKRSNQPGRSSRVVKHTWLCHEGICRRDGCQNRIQAGDIIASDLSRPGSFRKSDEPYSKLVAGARGFTQ